MIAAKRRATRAWLPVLAAAGVLLAADTAAWWVATSRLVDGLAEWRQALLRDGVELSGGVPQRAGWPLRAVLAIPDVTATAGVVSVHVPRVLLEWVPWQPQRLTVVSDGMATLSDAIGPKATAGAVRIAVPLDQPDQVGVEAREVAVTLPGGPAQVQSIGLDIAGQTVALALHDLTLPGRNLPFGGTVAEVQVAARTTGPLPPPGDPASVLAAWRGTGQRLAVERLVLHWGRLNLHGTASLALDAAMQPAGSGTVQMTGFTELVGALARSGAITASDARVANTLLGLVTRPGSTDGPEAELPWTLKDRILSVGLIPLLRMPVLALP